MISAKDRYIHPKLDIREAQDRLASHPYFLHLHASLMDEQGVFLILMIGEIWTCDENGDSIKMDINGTWRPGPPVEDAFITLYGIRDDIKAIINGHSNALESFALVKSVPNTKALHQLFMICGLPEFVPGSLTRQGFYIGLQEQFKNPSTRCILTSSDGVYCVGRSLKEAFSVFETIDFTARMILRSLRVGLPYSLSNIQLYRHEAFSGSGQSFEENHFLRGVTSNEKQHRLDIIECLRMCIQKSLMSSTNGSISYRLAPDQILITPTGYDRAKIEASDILLVQRNNLDGSYHVLNFLGDPKDSVPSRALKCHFEIYNRHEDVNSIISSHPLNISVLCSVHSGIESVYMPAPYSALSRVIPLDYDACLCPVYVAESFDKPLAGSVNCLLIANDGAIIVGKSLQETYNRLQILESACSIAIDACSLGCQEELFLVQRS